MILAKLLHQNVEKDYQENSLHKAAIFFFKNLHIHHTYKKSKHWLNANIDSIYLEIMYLLNFPLALSYMHKYLDKLSKYQTSHQ